MWQSPASQCAASLPLLLVLLHIPCPGWVGLCSHAETDSDWSGSVDILEPLTTVVFICKFITRETVRSIYQAPVGPAEHKLSEMLIKEPTWKHSTASIMWEWPRVMLSQPWIKHRLQLLLIHCCYSRCVCAVYSATMVAKTFLSRNKETQKTNKNKNK